jgi:NAD(P)H-dependent flavin oxidoreductase YrpB (nitropropane dioxygenase family)
MRFPEVDQGGMGVYISTPFLANAVARLGGLGTVSGVAADKLLARMLQSGDPGGHFRRALSHCPFPNIAQEVLDEYFVVGGIAPTAPYKPVPMMLVADPSPLSIKLLVCANFAFVWLAKEGHPNPVSINWLEKMQRFHLYSIAGAMLAGVDVVTMGAGIPLQIPAILDAYAQGQPAEYRVSVTGGGDGTIIMRFDPREFFGRSWPTRLHRPSFLPVVSSHVLAMIMMEKLPGGIQGFVVEGPTAGGHNAWPRGKPITYNDWGEPIYGKRDEPDFGVLRNLGIPFYLAGAYASPGGLAPARSVGAHGIQVGSIFALTDQSGLHWLFRRDVIRRYHRGGLSVKQDPSASPTGYPFQVVQLPDTMSDETVYRDRQRMCNHHGLSVPHQLPDGKIVYRCPAEPIGDYTHKGGIELDTLGARCLCNGLIATTGHGDPGESAIVTLGSDLSFLNHLTKTENSTYTVTQTMEYLQG